MLILDECCLKHVPYEILDKIPTEDDWDYPVPFIRIDKKDKRAWILVDNKDGKATWIEISNDINSIEKILLDCGEVIPNENGEIKLEGRCGIRTTSNDCPDYCIDMLTGYGLKGGGRICNGESRTIELDAEITGDVKGPYRAKMGDVPVFKDQTGKSITTSNINSVDGLTKITKNTKGEQKLLVETVDTESGSNAGIEAKSAGSGTPYFQLTQGDQKWRRIINPETGALEIRPVDDLSKGSILTMLPNGVILMPWQPKATATLGRTPNFPASTELELGSNLSFTKIRDEDGYNTSANNFFIGSAGKRAYYKAPYKGSYFVKYQFLVDSGESTMNNIYMYVKIFWGKDGGEEFSAYNRGRFAVPSFLTMSDSGIIFLEKDDIIHINVNVQRGNPYITVRDEQPRAIENYWEVIFLG